MESKEHFKNLESHVAIITKRLTTAIITWRCSQNWEENLLVYCFPENLVSISFFCYSTLHFSSDALFSYQRYFSSADSPPCALLLWVFQQVLETYIHINALFPGCHCGMSVRFTEEFSMSEFSTHFSFLAGLLLLVEQLMWVNVCAVVPAGRSSADLSILYLSSLVLYICSGMQQRSE